MKQSRDGPVCVPLGFSDFWFFLGFSNFRSNFPGFLSFCSDFPGFSNFCLRSRFACLFFCFLFSELLGRHAAVFCKGLG